MAIAYRAIQNGFEARFITADELIGDLSAAAQSGTLDALEPYLHPHVVIDELGYESYAADAANFLSWLSPRGDKVQRETATEFSSETHTLPQVCVCACLRARGKHIRDRRCGPWPCAYVPPTLFLHGSSNVSKR